MTNKINGSTALLEQLEQSTAEIKKDIARLYEEKEKLESTLEDTDDQFKLDNVKNNYAIQGDINLINQAINKAEKKLAEKTVANEEKAFNTAVALIQDYRKEANEENKTLNAEIIKHIEETRELFAEMKERDNAYQSEISGLVNSLYPYFNHDNVNGTNVLKSNYGELRHTHADRFKPLYKTSVLDIVDERSFAIKGLVTEPRENRREQDEKEKYMK